jgi:hypothetical protein
LRIAVARTNNCAVRRRIGQFALDIQRALGDVSLESREERTDPVAPRRIAPPATHVGLLFEQAKSKYCARPARALRLVRLRRSVAIGIRHFASLSNLHVVANRVLTSRHSRALAK